MPDRKQILLRLDPAVHDALARWAGTELRSTTAHIEYLLRQALSQAGRLPPDVGELPRRGRPPKTGQTRQPRQTSQPSQPSQPAPEATAGDADPELVPDPEPTTPAPDRQPEERP